MQTTLPHLATYPLTSDPNAGAYKLSLVNSPPLLFPSTFPNLNYLSLPTHTTALIWILHHIYSPTTPYSKQDPERLTTPLTVGSKTTAMNLKEALPMAEIVLGTTETEIPREGNQLAVAAPPAGMTFALALPILIPNSPPVVTIAGEAGVPRPQADRQRAPLSDQRKSRSQTQRPQQVSPLSTLYHTTLL